MIINLPDNDPNACFLFGMFCGWWYGILFSIIAVLIIQTFIELRDGVSGRQQSRHDTASDDTSKPE
jgi:hypothetical protein